MAAGCTGKPDSISDNTINPKKILTGYVLCGREKVAF